MPSFQKSLIVEQFQGNYLKGEIICGNTIINHTALNVLIEKLDPMYEILSKVESFKTFEKRVPFYRVNAFRKSINIKRPGIFSISVNSMKSRRDLTVSAI